MVLPGVVSHPSGVRRAGLLCRFTFPALLALLLAPAAPAGPGLRIGVVDDAPIWRDPTTEVDLAKGAGFDSVRMTARWSAGQTGMTPGQTERLQRAAMFASMQGLNPIVSIYNANGASTPTAPDFRAQFVEFAKSVVHGYTIVVRAYDACGNVGAKTVVLNARRATRGDAAISGRRWVLTVAKAAPTPHARKPRPRG
jgi:hypothetical protein